MKRIELHGPEDVRLVEVDDPTPGPRDAVVGVAACGICGSDLGYIKLGGLAGPTGQPMPLGHELAGVVEAVGEEVEGFAPGARVTVNPLGGGVNIGNGGTEGGFAQRLLVRNAADGKSLFEIPDSMPFEIGALAEPLGVGMNAVDKTGAQPGEKIVVFGAGPIGLAAVATLRHRGFNDVVSIDLSDHRLGLARELGARETLNAGEIDVWQHLEKLHGREVFYGIPVVGSDAWIEASGAPVIPDIIANARPGARLSVVALHRQEVPVNFMLVMMKELQITGAIEYPDDYTQSLDVLRETDVSPMVTHRFPLERFDEALGVARDPKVAGKVVIEPR
ncbi:MAG: zinc-binding dehydrogenase [Myxococcota bacterium]|jgi:threonine dehydrogenase-like Zn-dependent dehydrogenase|nr:alcohol dehydrogenase [Deltaproteobacteria bacterium]MCP4241771.1 zinc-binding dehydrogenase [bacterium]MDP6075963.1 zinc-binding dehydrogenase [Myxococcota bacterium]MDP6242346.1 zinc-binding dehydrogenase [Myxococcota bacterium]MDP7076041.1 zinc-binding dehydrogenase [Myxococcota bacterium]